MVKSSSLYISVNVGQGSCLSDRASCLDKAFIHDDNPLYNIQHISLVQRVIPAFILRLFLSLLKSRVQFIAFPPLEAVYLLSLVFFSFSFLLFIHHRLCLSVLACCCLWFSSLSKMVGYEISTRNQHVTFWLCQDVSKPWNLNNLLPTCLLSLIHLFFVFVLSLFTGFPFISIFYVFV